VKKQRSDLSRRKNEKFSLTPELAKKKALEKCFKFKFIIRI
jgi:hypothetical protein